MTAENSKMNVVLVLADQHNANLLGCAGHPQVKTPNLDAFAASGVRFTQAYAQNTICTPSRVSVLSGQYCHNHGYYGLSGPADAGLDNFMRHFKKNGYRTAGYGKLHLPESPRNWLADHLDDFGCAYENADGVFGASRYLKHLKQLGIRELEDSWHNTFGTYSAKPITYDAMVSKMPYEHTQEMWCVQEAIKFMESSDKPFCIKVDFQRPHHPLLPQQQFWDMYPEDIELPATYSLNPQHRPPHFQAMYNQTRSIEWPYNQENQTYVDALKRAWRGTLACTTQVDDVFGRLMAYLEKTGRAENTIVIYSSDHGAYHGIHGIIEKAPGICSDEVCRVPMIWRAPGVAGEKRVCDALVESVDIAPTICALCDLDAMPAVDGQNISPLLNGQAKKVRDVAVTENVWSKAIRWDDWRFVHYQKKMFDGNDYAELYDLKTDPQETNNLYNNPQYAQIAAHGRRLLLEWLIETTRVKTCHVAVKTTEKKEEDTWKNTYPICSDGTAPNEVQPRNREYPANYL